jgi:hypothetical protein
MTPALTPGPATSLTGYSVAGLKPSLGNAANDRESIWDDDCEVKSFQTQPCNKVYGDPNGTYTVALVGDSHAAAMFPAVQEVALAHHWRLEIFIKVGCQFLDEQLWYDDTTKREYTECPTFKNNSIAKMNANPPDLILVMNNRYADAFVSGQGSATYQGQAYGREIAKLPKQSRVVIIADYPYAPTSIPDCLSSHTSDWRACAFARARGLGGASAGQREAIAAQMTGADILSMEQAVCPGKGACEPVVNGMIIFRDEHHLTATFARSIAPYLDQQLVTILLTPRK